MRFNSDLLVLLILTMAWLSGCAAPASRPSEVHPPATSADSTTAGKSQPINLLAQQQYEHALAAMKAKRDDQAERLLLTMTQAYPELAGPYVNLGIIYYRSGRTQAAVQAFRKALEISPQRADAYNHLGILLREDGRFSEARVAYEKALQIDPSYAYAHLNLGILHDLYLLNAKQALHHYELYQKLMPSPDPEVNKWIVDLQRRMHSSSQSTAGR
jgi:tetratricopeptide (TPR) repeat protein